IVLWMSKVPVHGLPAFREDDEELAAAAGPDRAMSGQDSAANNVEATRTQAQTAALARAESIRQSAHASMAARLGQSYNPPNAGCSPNAVSTGGSTPNTTENDAVSIPAEGTYLTLNEIKDAARRQFSRPAQAAVALERETPQSSDRLSLAEEFVDKSNHGPWPLSRKERRVRERKLRRALAKR